MARRYTYTRENVTPVVGEDIMTIVAASNKPILIRRVQLEGLGSAGAVNRTVIQRSTGGTTPGGAIAAEKASPNDPTPDTVVDTTWAAQPTLSGRPLYNKGWNALGGGFDLPLDGREILVTNGQVSIRNTAGTSPINITVEIEEL